MKSRRTLFGMTLILLLMTLVLAACQDSVTATPATNPTTPATTSTSQAAAITNLPLPTFTPVPTQALPTVTPAPTIPVATNTVVATTTIAAATTTEATTVAITTTPPATTTVAPTRTTAPVTTVKPTAAPKISPVFNSVLPDLRRQKEVPVMLPTYIPGTEVGPVYAIIERSDKPGYSIVLGYTPDCEGGTACRVGTVAGQPDSKSAQADLKGTKVKLANNVTGYFTAASCGANCSDATLSWKEGKGVYTVGIKAGKLEELTRMANSAIAAGQL